LDGEGAFDHDSTNRCPGATTTYTLVARSPGGEDQASVTVTVTEAPTPTPTVPPLDTTPPDIVNPQAEPDEILKEGPGCPAYSRTTTVSATVTDAGGVASVVARWNLGSDSEEVAMTFSGGDVYEAVLGPFNSTGQLLIVIVAWDQAGNTAQVGPLTVQVDQCVT